MDVHYSNLILYLKAYEDLDMIIYLVAIPLDMECPRGFTLI